MRKALTGVAVAATAIAGCSGSAPTPAPAQTLAVSSCRLPMTTASQLKDCDGPYQGVAFDDISAGAKSRYRVQIVIESKDPDAIMRSLGKAIRESELTNSEVTIFAVGSSGTSAGYTRGRAVIAGHVATVDICTSVTTHTLGSQSVETCDEQQTFTMPTR